MGKLYDISERYRNLSDLIDNPDIQVYDMLEALSEVEAEFEDKVANIVKIIKNVESDIEIHRAEEKRISTRRKALENKLTNLKKYLDSNMRLLDKKKIQTGTFTVSMRKNPPSLVVKEMDHVPAEYKKEKIEYEIDKKSIINLWKLTGENIEGCEVVQNESLAIR